MLDRLVWYRAADGQPGAEVIDFKTDDVPAAAVPTRAGHYRPQLEAYRLAVARFGRIPIDHIALTLLFTTPGCVVGFEPE
jgi:hypothetical protein